MSMGMKRNVGQASKAIAPPTAAKVGDNGIRFCQTQKDMPVTKGSAKGISASIRPGRSTAIVTP